MTVFNVSELLRPSIQERWAKMTLGQRFVWAAKGWVQIEREGFCAALAIDEYPDHTMTWFEWCHWLYQEMTGRPWAAAPRSNGEVWTAIKMAEKLAPLIDQRADMLAADAPLEEEGRHKEGREGVTCDSYDAHGYSVIHASNGQTYEVVARTDTWHSGMYHQTMLLHWDTASMDETGVVERSRGWATLQQTKPTPDPTINECHIEVASREDAVEEYERMASEMMNQKITAIMTVESGRTRR